jgi:hypothetical protein
MKRYRIKQQIKAVYKDYLNIKSGSSYLGRILKPYFPSFVRNYDQQDVEESGLTPIGIKEYKWPYLRYIKYEKELK